MKVTETLKALIFMKLKASEFDLAQWDNDTLLKLIDEVIVPAIEMWRGN